MHEVEREIRTALDNIYAIFSTGDPRVLTEPDLRRILLDMMDMGFEEGVEMFITQQQSQGR